MMNRLMNKIRSKRGETLVEILVSTAILALAMTILAGLLTTSYRLDESARNADDNLYKDLEAAESADDSSNILDNAKVYIKSDVTAKIDIDIYGSEGSDLKAYKKR